MKYGFNPDKTKAPIALKKIRTEYERYYSTEIYTDRMEIKTLSFAQVENPENCIPVITAEIAKRESYGDEDIAYSTYNYPFNVVLYDYGPGLEPNTFVVDVYVNVSGWQDSSNDFLKVYVNLYEC